MNKENLLEEEISSEKVMIICRGKYKLRLAKVSNYCKITGVSWGLIAYSDKPLSSKHFDLIAMKKSIFFPLRK